MCYEYVCYLLELSLFDHGDLNQFQYDLLHGDYILINMCVLCLGRAIVFQLSKGIVLSSIIEYTIISCHFPAHCELLYPFPNQARQGTQQCEE